MKTNEFTTRFQTDKTYRALIGASRQLELRGWCPKANGNNLNNYYDTCELAHKDGVMGCHKCVAEYFLIRAE